MGDAEEMGANFFFDVISKSVEQLLDPIFSQLVFVFVVLYFILAALG